MEGAGGFEGAPRRERPAEECADEEEEQRSLPARVEWSSVPHEFSPPLPHDSAPGPLREAGSWPPEWPPRKEPWVQRTPGPSLPGGDSRATLAADGGAAAEVGGTVASAFTLGGDAAAEAGPMPSPIRRQLLPRYGAGAEAGAPWGDAAQGAVAPGGGSQSASAASAAPRSAGAAARAPALSSGAAVLVDGLERDNAILRQQLERHFATERALRAEADELSERLQWSRQRREAETAAVEAEGARLRSAIQRQEESTGGVAAKIEELLGFCSAEDAARAACESGAVEAEEQVGRVTKELEGLQRLVLPNSRVESPDDCPPADAFPLQGALLRARHAAKQLRFACEAKLDTLRSVQQQLSLRLRAAPAGAPPQRVGSAAGSAAGSAGPAEVPVGARALGGRGVGASFGADCGGGRGAGAPAAPAAAEGPGRREREAEEGRAVEALRAQVELARREADQERARCARASQRAAERRGGWERTATALSEAQQALTEREAEVRRLQLLGKYFAHQGEPSPQELADAERAEERHARCAGLSEEASRLRLERDLLRAEGRRAHRQASRGVRGPDPLAVAAGAWAVEPELAVAAGTWAAEPEGARRRLMATAVSAGGS